MTFGLSIWPDNLPAACTVDTAATSYSAIFATGAKASWVEVISDANVTADCYGVYVEVQKTATSATDTSCILDIGVDAAGGTSYTALVSNLLCGYADDWNAGVGRGGARRYFVPVKITSGSAVAIRGRTVEGSNQDGSIKVQLLGGATGTPYGGASVETLGVTESTSKGTSVTPGAATTWGSWTNIGSTLSANAQAFVVGVQPAGATVVNRCAYQLQIGVSSSAISQTFTLQGTTEECVDGPFPVMPAYYYVASGSQMQVRMRGTSGSTQAFDVALYAVSAA